MNNEVIRIYGIKNEEEKPVEFEKMLGLTGKVETNDKPTDYARVVYLGKCQIDGDMFAAYGKEGTIEIFIGNLKSGKY